ncbi:MAG: hypothetical protein KC620_12485 [Myxococcales bacterium]|nr:hypothetical protein [Myxococcales bacterium]
MQSVEIRFTNDFDEARRLRDAGFEPIECAFGQHGSVLGPLALDHHGEESHREGVAIRACRDLYAERAADPRFVVTGTPDADATLAIVALAGLVPRTAIPTSFHELVDAYDVDPIGRDLLATPEGEMLAWFNQQPHLGQSAKGFQTAVAAMCRLLRDGLTATDRERVRKSDLHRRRKALDGVVALLARDGRALDVAAEPFALPVRRGELAAADPGRVLVVQSAVWGFDQWYRLAPVVVSFAARAGRVTVGCPDVDTARRLFGAEGLNHAWRALGHGWGGRESIGGSPRGARQGLADARATAEALLDLLMV